MSDTESVIPDYLSAPFGEDTVPPDPDDRDRSLASSRSGGTRTVETLLEDGQGIFGYYKSSKRYGTRSTVDALKEVARIWSLRHDRPRIGVGDISLQRGGDIIGHASHETGRDVDIRPIRRDGTEAPTTIFDPIYSHELTQELVDLLYCSGVVRVKSLFFNDPNIQGSSYWAKHDNHLHVRFHFLDDGPGYPRLLAGGPDRAPVREMQRRLGHWARKTGYGTEPVIDGVFGNRTFEAVLAFQVHQGVEPDGVFGQASWLASMPFLLP